MRKDLDTTQQQNTSELHCRSEDTQLSSEGGVWFSPHPPPKRGRDQQGTGPRSAAQVCVSAGVLSVRWCAWSVPVCVSSNLKIRPPC
ncbi:unnamed protein product [Arctogadus glacialis]